MLFAKFGGAPLLTLFGWLWCHVLHLGQFLFWTISFACFLLGHVYLLLCFSFFFLLFMPALMELVAHLFGMLG